MMDCRSVPRFDYLKDFFVLFFFLFFFPFSVLNAQNIDDIKKRQEQTEKEIKYLNNLIKGTKDDQYVTMEKLTLLNEKVNKGKVRLNILLDEVAYLEKQIEKNQLLAVDMGLRRQQLLSFYEKLIYETWKKKKRTDPLTYLFSSSNLRQAYARYKYFEQIQDYTKVQLEMIGKVNDSLRIVNTELEQSIAQKNLLQKEIYSSNQELTQEQKKANDYADKLKKQEKDLNKKLQAEIKKREEYKNQLRKVIESQIKKSGSNTNKYNLTPQEKLISDDFAKNKGRLPWPVVEGFVSEKYGVHVSSLARLVQLKNDGITITTSAGADVQAVFDGVVSEIMFIAGQNNAIVVRHGNYFTVYNNIVKAYVKKGETIKVKQPIGKLSSGDGNSTTINFQVWKDSDSYDPQQWLSK